MTTKLNSKGFAAIESLLIVIILAIIGGTGYYVWQANHNYNSLNPNAGLQSTSTKENSTKNNTASNYLTIPEWGVRATLPANVTPQYKLTSSGSQVWAKLTTKELAAADSGCTGDAGGIIIRALGNDHVYTDDGEDTGKTVKDTISAGQLAPYKKVGDYYYWFEQGQAACGSGSDSARTAQHKTFVAFRAAIKTLETIPAQ